MDYGCKFTSGVHCEVKEGGEPDCSKCGWNPDFEYKRKEILRISHRVRIEKKNENVHIVFNHITFVVPVSALRRVLDGR